MQVRAAASSDLDQVMALYSQLSPTAPLAAPDKAPAIWDQILTQPGVTVFVAEDDGGLVSTCILIVTPNLTRAGRPYGLIENVVTLEDRRGEGLGRAVIHAAFAHAWAQDCYKVMLLTGRKDAVGFYEACGFTAEEKTGLVARPPA